MSLKNLSGKSVYDLGMEEFNDLFCKVCKEKTTCDQDFKTLNVCQQLIDQGIWDNLFRKRLQGE